MNLYYLQQRNAINQKKEREMQKIADELVRRTREAEAERDACLQACDNALQNCLEGCHNQGGG